MFIVPVIASERKRAKQSSTVAVEAESVILSAAKDLRILAATLCAIFFFNTPSALAQESPKLFGSEPLAGELDKGRDLIECASQLTRFLVTPRSDFQGFAEDVADYILDFTLWPAHYADVINIQTQLDRAKLGVMSAFFRCDLEKLPTLMEGYDRLEAELYFVRHFVDTSRGFAYFKATGDLNRSKREKFKRDMTRSLVSRSNAKKDGARFEAYFDIFEKKYTSRQETYKPASGDGVYDELIAKAKQLGETFTSAGGGFVDEVAALGDDVADAGSDVVAAGSAVAGSTVQAFGSFENFGNAMLNVVSEIDNRFKICPATGDPDTCETLGSGLGKGWEVAKEIGTGQGTGDDVIAVLNEDDNDKPTFNDVKVLESIVVEVAEEASRRKEMLTRYELLYGQVNGDGVSAIMKRLDNFTGTIKASFPFLEQVEVCADDVQGSVCS